MLKFSCHTNPLPHFLAFHNENVLGIYFSKGHTIFFLFVP